MLFTTKTIIIQIRNTNMEELEPGSMEALRARILTSLKDFHNSEPRLTTDPEEQARRLDLLKEDPIYIGLQEQYRSSTDVDRLGTASILARRRWEIMTSNDPDQLIAQAKEPQNQ